MKREEIGGERRGEWNNMVPTRHDRNRLGGCNVEGDLPCNR